MLLIVSQVNLLDRLDRAYLEIARMREIGEFVTSPGVTLVPLWGTDAARGAHAKLAYEHATGVELTGAVMFGTEMIDEASRKMAEQLALRGRAAGLQRVKSLEDFTKVDDE